MFRSLLDGNRNRDRSPRCRRAGAASLIIGANAVILLGYIRNTTDLDFLIPEEKRSEWLDLLRELDFRFFHGTEAFAPDGSGRRGGPPLDLMFVDPQTWSRLLEGARPAELAEERVLLPRPEYLFALKLHAASSPTRSKPEVDWEDIRQIVRICASIPRRIFPRAILRYGGKDALPGSKASEASKLCSRPQFAGVQRADG